MHIEFDNECHFSDFIRLNEQWISEHFQLEDSDRKLASNPIKVINDGGHILSLVDSGRVVGVCALFKENETSYQLARMAVDSSERGKGYGKALIEAALNRAKERGACRVILFSNTVLAPAVGLYRKYGFTTTCEGNHPLYARCNIVMERAL